MCRFDLSFGMHCTVFDFVLIHYIGSYFPYGKRTVILC